MNKKLRKSLEKALKDVIQEFKSASSSHPKFNSAHEGYAVLLEEVDELKAEVWKRPSKRKIKRLHDEAVQVGAMALRFLVDCAS